jgi:hypothetical protein
MAGLLDQNYRPDPLAQGLLGFGTALMTPRQMGGGMAAGMQAFGQGAQEAQRERARMAQDAQRQKMLEQQMEMQQKRFGMDEQEFGLRRDELGLKRTQAQTAQEQAERVAAARVAFQQAYQQSGGKWSPQLSVMAMDANIKGEDIERLARGEFLGQQPLTWQGGVGRHPMTGAPVAAAPDVNKPFFPSLVNGQVQASPNAAVQNYEVTRAREGATRVNQPVSFNTDRTYAGAMADLLAKRDGAVLTAAENAPKGIESAQRVKQLLGQNPITGTGATFSTAIGKALATAGLIDGQRIKTTEDLASELASGTLDAIASSGLGSGQGFTDKDRQFLQEARSGRIELNAGTIYRLADLRERSERASIRRGNEVGSRLRNDPKMGTVGQNLNYVEPPKVALPLPSTLTPQNLIIGAEYDLGQRGKAVWNGMAFDPVKE